MRCKWIGLALLLAACAPHQESETPEARCEKLRDHLVDLRIKDVRGATAGLDLDAHRAALTRALGSDFTSACATQMTDAQIDCAISSSTLAASTKCTEASAVAAEGGAR